MAENKLICPYCDKPLHCGAQLDSDGCIIDLYQCANPECESTEFLVGCKEFWDILGQHKRTRKALDVAVDTLNKYEWNGSFNHNGEFDLDMKEMTLAHKALEQITELEQKDK